jgi:hypothetical protein
MNEQSISKDTSLDTDTAQYLDLLKKHRQNLAYLKRQAVLHGLDVPLAIHNAIIAEQDAIADLEKQLTEAGVDLVPEPTWKALIVEADSHWREIISVVLDGFGGSVVRYDKIPDGDIQDIVKDCRIIVISPFVMIEAMPLLDQWINQDHHASVILMTEPAERDHAIKIRQLLQSKREKIRVSTIFKNMFDIEWFSKVIQHSLSYRQNGTESLDE